MFAVGKPMFRSTWGNNKESEKKRKEHQIARVCWSLPRTHDGWMPVIGSPMFAGRWILRPVSQPCARFRPKPHLFSGQSLK